MAYRRRRSFSRRGYRSRIRRRGRTGFARRYSPRRGRGRLRRRFRSIGYRM